MSIKLISFPICPYVQRSVMLLEQLGREYEVEYIDLANPPEWFLALSPLGKVPVMQVDDTVLFESHVILEYLNEVADTNRHPADPLEKARHRAMMEFGSAMLGSQWMTMAAKDEAHLNKHLSALKSQMATLESSIAAAPFYAGDELSLIDFSFAPLLQRLDIVKRHYVPDLFDGFPKIAAWTQALIELDVLKASAVPDLEARILKAMKDMDSYLAA
jgi:glutathione S-transferase